jgi:hypothetical protein
MHPVQQMALPVEARPVVQRLSDGLFPQAERIREDLYLAFEGLLQSLRVEGLVLQSGAHVHPCWVSFECWLPQENRLLTERVSAVVAVEPQPFHRFEIIYNLSWNNRGKPKSVNGLRHFTAQEAAMLAQYLVTGGAEPNFSSLQIRQKSWQIWKPENKVNAVGRDWLGTLPLVLIVLGLATIAFGIGVFLLLGGILAFWLLSRRPCTVRSSGKPLFEPRNLQRVDSWQTVVSGAGIDAAIVRQRFLDAIEDPPSQNFRCTYERIWYWGLDTKEEREQVILTLGRAILFAQIYGYGRDLYVGWDAHLNNGTWVEKTLATGIDSTTGRLTRINTVVQGWQRLTEYDVSDVSCLTEWAHSQLVRIIKRYMEERRIDQEIDFKIIRGERQGMTAATQESVGKRAGGLIQRIRNRASA